MKTPRRRSFNDPNGYQRPESPSRPKVIRCAVYTRVSTDHGLEQEFNSLDAQREASAAYVKSQMHEGWTLNPASYDDGGFSGGSMERPALARLLADIEAGKIDTVVVYKVDRLTRSLADFAKLIELFEEHGVSFVSVTQSFNTTTSMGRLTLNVLLSFAQFEREVAGERIRDKVAASKRKGIWVGGVIPLGYRVENRKLLVDEAEAATVRMIFERYHALGSMTALLTELHQRGVITRTRTLATGRTIGGIPIGKGALGYLLKNRTYIGDLNHRDRSYPGEHPPIIDRDLFDAVQAKLIKNRAVVHHRQASSEALLLGRIYDDRGNRMTPTHSRKNGARYRYYTSRALTEGRRDTAGSVTRVSAPDIEALVLTAVRSRMLARASADHADGEPNDVGMGGKLTLSGHVPSATSVNVNRSMGNGTASARDDRALIASAVERVVINTSVVDVQLTEDINPDAASAVVSVPWSKPPIRRRRELLQPTDRVGGDAPAMTEGARTKLLEAIVRARSWLDQIVSGAESIDAIAQREGRSQRSIRMTLPLALLAPTVVKVIVGGTLPHGVGVHRLIDLPMDWSEIRSRFVL